MQITDIYVEAAEVQLRCDSCGMTGTISREVGNLEGRVGTFARAHLDPHVVGVRLVGPLGEFLGWWTA